MAPRPSPRKRSPVRFVQTIRIKTGRFLTVTRRSHRFWSFPGSPRVIALPPEFVTPQDGAAKQDCEINAATRWLDRHGSHDASWGATLLGDDLYSREPFCREALAAGFDYLFVCKTASHKTLYEWVGDLATTLVRHRTEGLRKIRDETDTYRFMNKVPLRDGKDALRGNWFELITTDKLTGRLLFHGSWVTSLGVTEENIAEMVLCARARWKVENENNNVLKTKGYNLEHNFGHGRKNLSNVLATFNIYSFLVHTATCIL